jgi:hypothetical protein
VISSIALSAFPQAGEDMTSGTKIRMSRGDAEKRIRGILAGGDGDVEVQVIAKPSTSISGERK